MCRAGKRVKDGDEGVDNKLWFRMNQYCVWYMFSIFDLFDSDYQDDQPICVIDLWEGWTQCALHSFVCLLPPNDFQVKLLFWFPLVHSLNQRVDKVKLRYLFWHLAASLISPSENRPTLTKRMIRQNPKSRLESQFYPHCRSSRFLFFHIKEGSNLIKTRRW